jgi:CRP/FNR family transcriptional regulator
MQKGMAEPGQTFIDEGSPAGSFFNITSGTVKLFKLLPDGRRQITGFLRAGDFLGLAVSSTYAFSAEAIGRVCYCRFARSRLRTLLAELPQMEHRLLEVASNELVAAQEQMLLLGRKTARERVASFLVAQARRSPAASVGAIAVSLPMTRADIADYLGLTIETVSRTMTRLRRDGLIAFDAPSEIRIQDWAVLERIADGLA